MTVLRKPTEECKPPSAWRKSSFSNGSCACVEVRTTGHAVELRDSKYQRDPRNDLAAQPIIRLGYREYDAWILQVGEQRSDFTTDAISTVTAAGGETTVTCRSSGVSLTFTIAEWSAFVAGVDANEFASALTAA